MISATTGTPALPNLASKTRAVVATPLPKLAASVSEALPWFPRRQRSFPNQEGGPNLQSEGAGEASEEIDRDNTWDSDTIANALTMFIVFPILLFILIVS